MDFPTILEDAKKRSGLSEDDDVLSRWANQGYQKRNRKIAAAIPDFFLTSASISIVSGTAIYNLPADFLRNLKIEDENGNIVDKVDPQDPSKPDGWYFYGQTIAAGVRYERIRVQSAGAAPTANATWTLHYVFQPPDLDTTTNTILYWPDAIHEVLVFEILKRWMEDDEQSDRKAEYKDDLREADAAFTELLNDRGNQPGSTPLVLSPEDFD
jgi:hypothetical protein